jgi:DTW domain-containing protein YfiP
MKIYLLTHQRELDRKTNTGKIVLNCLGDKAKQVIWDRVNPDQELIELIQNKNISLLYPGENAKLLNLECFENILLIDSTWQEANKIYNRSPYLKEIEKLIKQELGLENRIRR